MENIKLSQVQKDAVCSFLGCEEKELDIRGYNIYQVPVVRNINNIGMAVSVQNNGNIGVFDTTPYKTKEQAIKAYIKRGY